MGFFDPPHTVVLKHLSPELAPGARTIVDTITRDLSMPSVHKVDVSFAITVCLAAWVNELEKVGALGSVPMNLEYIYEAGRVAAQSMKRRETILPYVEASMRRKHLLELRPS